MVVLFYIPIYSPTLYGIMKYRRIDIMSRRKKYFTEEDKKEAKRRDTRKWREKNAEQVRETSRLWRLNNRDKRREYKRQWAKDNPGRERERRYRSKLKERGLTLEQYQSMLRQQKGTCGICRKENPNGQRLAVDHDHVTGSVRGLLCIVCNAALSRLEKDVTWAEKALKYLHKFK
jgi:hypothetical protein